MALYVDEYNRGNTTCVVPIVVALMTRYWNHAPWQTAMPYGGAGNALAAAIDSQVTIVQKTSSSWSLNAAGGGNLLIAPR